ncbi:aconitase X [Paraburkholderia sp. EG285A]|uniref:cis-3-hydroxy-L-proline dehydratase n=1 Tax=Paraburkholderia sp. EG285A TaxID=3237009 RepID=UPI0034D37479
MVAIKNFDEEVGSLEGRVLVEGSAQAELVYSGMGLSFWGGVEPFTGEVIDRHHPLSGQFVNGRILAIPSGRGSCTGSSVMLELILNGHAPAGLILAEPDEILTLGVLVAQEVFGKSFPVVSLGAEFFSKLEGAPAVRISEGQVTILDEVPDEGWSIPHADQNAFVPAQSILLSDVDSKILRGESGKAAQVAMQLVLRMAELQGAKELIDVSQAHIDGCIYTGPASLRFAEQLVQWGGKVKVPTTLNSISVDKRKWQELGVDKAFGEPASALGDAYLNMGARVSFTCAPYLLDSKPKLGEQIVWAESNAVLFANSVLGARTLKYPDYLDISIALTGRAPFVGSHVEAGRRATMRIDVQKPEAADDAFWPLLGYTVGLLAKTEIPVVCGLENALPQLDDLKAFSAAFATTSASPMFHIVGATPEAKTVEEALGAREPTKILAIGRDDLATSWRELDSSPEHAVQLVSLGNPHFSITECEYLAKLCAGRSKHPDTELVVTMGREINDQAAAAGYVATLEQFGATLITDTCWCMLGEPVIPRHTSTLMTNSGKYAHYAPGLVGRKVRFGSLADCVEAACQGQLPTRLPVWLS